MELKKCKNCGAFINSEGDFCSSCANTLSFNTTVLNDYFGGAANFDSITNIASQTGVSPSIVENYMIKNNIIDSASLEKTSFANLPY